MSKKPLSAIVSLALLTLSAAGASRFVSWQTKETAATEATTKVEAEVDSRAGTEVKADSVKPRFKVSTTTSNFMMGVTACASAVVYVQRGIIAPGIACPVMIGVLFGALTGARLLKRMNVRVLRQIFCVAITLVALNMIWQGFSGAY